MSDQAISTTHAQHYISAAAQNHNTIVRLREELALAHARIAELTKETA